MNIYIQSLDMAGEQSEKGIIATHSNQRDLCVDPQ